MGIFFFPFVIKRQNLYRSSLTFRDSYHILWGWYGISGSQQPSWESSPNEGSSGQMGLWSICSSEPQTRGLPVKATCKKNCFVGKKNKKMELAKELGLLASEDAQVWVLQKNSFPYVLWFYVGGDITVVEALNIPVGNLINSLIIPGHSRVSLWKSGYQRYRHRLLQLSPAVCIALVWETVCATCLEKQSHGTYPALTVNYAFFIWHKTLKNHTLRTACTKRCLSLEGHRLGCSR